jgi:molybdenum cofactor sulfurtransferase
MKLNGACVTFAVILVSFSVGFTSLLLSPRVPDQKHPGPDFISNHSDDYGYSGLLNDIRANDMHHLNASVYLDYTGSGLYRSSQLRQVLELYENNLFANPHSLSPASSYTTELVEEAREQVLHFLGTSSAKYTLIFTASATASLRLLAESFPWSKDSLYLYTRDNHNSVLGIRGWARHYGARFQTVDAEELEGVGRRKPAGTETVSHLFAFPPEENFAGRKYPLDWVKKFQLTDFPKKFAPGGTWYVLLDAAALLSTNPLNLTKYPADFVVMSFYKIFGFPNLGALAVRNEVVPHLRKMGFSGGTVVMATCGKDFALLQPRGCSRFEDGTVPFLSIAAIQEGLRAIGELGIQNISRHVWAVTREVYLRLSRLRHANGRPVLRIYGDHARDDRDTQGSIVTFNFMDDKGGFIGYNEVMKASRAEQINIRVGCFCNPGACTRANNLNDDQVESYYNKKTSCHDSIDIIDGVPLGAVRISVGAYTTMEDIDIFVKFVNKYFVH